MLDFGVTSGHSNALEFSDADYGASLDAFGAYSILIGIRPSLGSWAAGRHILSKVAGAGNGWSLETQNIAGSNFLRMVHNGGASPGNSITALTGLTTYNVIITWRADLDIFRYYINGTSEGDIFFPTGISDNAEPFYIGNGSGLITGAQVIVGPVVIWRNYALDPIEAAMGAAGDPLPAPSYIVFFHRCTAVPGIDEVQKILAVEQGTVNLLSDPVTDFYFLSNLRIQQHQKFATDALLSKATDEPVYRLRVPLPFLKIPLMGVFNVSHDSLMRSASQLADLEHHQLIDAWRRQVVRLIGMTEHRRDRALTLEFEDAEKAMATYFSTDKVVGGTRDHHPGLARRDEGGVIIVDRLTIAYLEQENDQVHIDAEGVYIAPVSVNIAKISYKGMICESGKANLVLNPIFATGLGSWTTTTGGGGTVTAVTNRLIMPDTLTANSIEVVGAAASENTFRQTTAMLAADGFARLSFLYSSRQLDSPDWKLQRSSDNFWWNDVTAAFQAGDFVNTTPTAYDTANSAEVVRRFFSKPIPISSNQNWTYRLGKLSPTVSSIHNFYLVNLTTGKFRFSPLLDTATTLPDIVYDSLTSSAIPPRQLAYAGRGTVSLELLADVDGGDLADGQQLALMVLQYGTSEKDFYALLYQKLAGQSVRFSWERWRDVAGTSTLDVRTTVNVVIVKDQLYRVCARYCSNPAAGLAELGLLARTMRLTVDEVNGTDVVASGMFSEAEPATKIWFGCSPAGTGWLPSMNYLSVQRVQPRVITDEETISV